MPESTNDKATARSRFVNDRLTLGKYALRKASSALVARLLQAPELSVSAPRRLLTVCAYASFGTEPDTAALIEALRERGVRVLLPVLLPDADLDWAIYDGTLVPGRLGLQEPTGERLGIEAISHADVVLVPALAISPTGQRLGRGGGSYDRALSRVTECQDSDPPCKRPWVCALVYDHELDAGFSVEAHDQPVDAACAPSRLVRFTATRGH
ncbi:5-formyltetrahydrofolate cyclo-ligase [Actinocrinis puniceicyclus]|uniref:5-formyltetrahydrofolate cyclo-ligase n=1 Tax=Actinocrinis puniceicyclus TaxID=977794 RepID=A0A8J7WI09_9ACTN|nr:5-formyltetrahydrofolate cyclo-ligase [Actinocrinis puniceicyclus]MBS2962641.1 5-formyltetrahydrofolate cyclo-ligase [Actinocrinis puniceicyclus]